jgi:hypothetical protein
VSDEVGRLQVSSGTQGVEDLFLKLAERLWALQRGDEGAPHLILPTKRNMLIRVSEQESKILLCSLLEDCDWHYSIETPTRKTYVQKGQNPQSARVDVSLYDTASPSSLSVNIELKSHNPGVESFRKDFEKLLREGVDGAWFHTLLGSNRTTVASVFEKITQAFETEQAHLGGAVRRMTFAFMGLDTQNTAIATFDVGGDQKEALACVKAVFDPRLLDAAEPAEPWVVYKRDAAGQTQRVGSFLSGSSRRGVGQGLRSGQLVLCPEIDPSTFLHLSVKGDSYYFRRYVDDRVFKFKTEGTRSFANLLDRYTFLVVEPATAEDYRNNVDKDIAYWTARVAGLNAQHGLPGSGPIG